jgi:hypothetical protein
MHRLEMIHSLDPLQDHSLHEGGGAIELGVCSELGSY